MVHAWFTKNYLEIRGSKAETHISSQINSDEPTFNSVMGGND
jgi:hypothetical protein